jgi:hypothetical protein
MKKICIICLYALTHIKGNAQVKEFLDINAKKEFAGIPFLSAPDYSKLEYKNRTTKGVNIYTLKGGQFKTDSFTLSEVFVSIQKGRVMNFLLPIKSENDYSKISLALSEAFETQVDLGESKTFHGNNIIFSLMKRQSNLNLFIATMDIDTIPEIKDKNGVIDLLGKKDSDPGVMNFIASIPGKKEKKEYSTGGYGYTWPGEGIVIDFKGKEGDATFNYMGIYFMKDNYYWRDKPFKGSAKLPYGITANTSLLQLRDMFGDEDPEFGSTSWRTKNYEKFKVYCNFGDPVKQNKDDLLNHISFK